MINKIRTAKEMVTHFLTIRPELRDDDNRLLANIWATQLNQAGIHDIGGFDLLKIISKGLLLSPESIRRARQKVQEENPTLRGKSYKARHEKAKEVSLLITQ